MYTVTTEKKGKKTIITSIVEDATGEECLPLYRFYTCPEDYIQDNVLGIEPMTAKEPLNNNELETMLTSEDYLAEEKLDGTRGTLHLNPKNRLFSRNISKQTNWYSENSDSVPHLRDFKVPKELHKTVLDGEMRIDGKEFKEVSSTLNCLWDEAILRQTQLGFITFHAFDIIYYKGVYVAKMPLIKRKELLRKVVEELDYEYIKEEFYTFNTKEVLLKDKQTRTIHYSDEWDEKYPNLVKQAREQIDPEHLEHADCLGADLDFNIVVDKKGWYEYIVMNGGEGMMLKHKDGTYRHTRGREYTKHKKFLTREVVILGFEEPTRDYTGKEVNNPDAKWNYWYDAEDEHMICTRELTMQEAQEDGLLPCTKHYAMDWIGTLRGGVIITQEELALLKKKNPKDKFVTQSICGTLYLEVVECSGFDEDTRKFLTENQADLIGTVVEIKANEILKTGRLRHPRFLRLRVDKESERCIWKDHMNL